MKTAVITGANRGIGLAPCKEYLWANCHGKFWHANGELTVVIDSTKIYFN